MTDTFSKVAGNTHQLVISLHVCQYQASWEVIVKTLKFMIAQKYEGISLTKEVRDPNKENLKSLKKD